MTVADSRIDELRRRLERDPGSRLFAQLAEEHRKAGEHAEAIRVARAGLVQHPAYPSARLTLGRALLDSGDAAGARVELEAALRDAPDNILASRFLGQALEALGELGPALVQLQKTLKMAPGDRQLESQIVSLQTRLRSPQAPAAPGGRGRRDGGASGLTAPFPRPPQPAPPEVEDVEGGPLPPTIRIHMPGDRGPRSYTPPLPPPLPPTAAPRGARVDIRSSSARGAGGATDSSGRRRHDTARQPAPHVGRALLRIGCRPDPPDLPSLPSSAWRTRPRRPRCRRGAVAAEETVFEAEAPPKPVLVPRAIPPPASVPDDAAAEGGATPFSSSTLAELYFKQGLVDRAVEVYRQVLDEEPGNERARSRLAELESASAPLEARAARRAALERTIAGLEALLVVLQRR